MVGYTKCVFHYQQSRHQLWNCTKYKEKLTLKIVSEVNEVAFNSMKNSKAIRKERPETFYSNTVN